MAWTPHTYVTFGGTIGEVTNTDEIWQCGVRVVDVHGGGSGVPFTPAHASDYADQLAGDGSIPLTQWFSAAHTLIPGTALMKWIKVATIGPDGDYSAAPIMRSVSAAGGGQAKTPMFMSVALSFRTSVVFGHKLKFGRVYPPNSGVAFVPGTSVISSADQDSLVLSAKELINAINVTDPDYAAEARVFSRQGGSSKIVSVRVGNIYDVQRRRKNAVRETYKVGTF